MIEKFLSHIAHQKRHSTHTVTSYRNDLEQFEKFLEQSYQCDLLEADHNLLRSWVVSLADQSLKVASINRKIATLKSFYKFLQRQEYISLNPSLRIKSLKAPKRNPAFIEEVAIEKLLDHLEFTSDFPSQRDRLVLELLYQTGMRQAELLGLQESDIEWHNAEIKVTGKGNKQRLIPLQANLLHLLEQYIALKANTFSQRPAASLIVTDQGEPAYPVLIYRIVKKYLEYVTTSQKKSPHILRHTFATHLLNRGADLSAIKEVLGHANLQATQVYTHNSLERLKEIFEQAHPKA